MTVIANENASLNHEVQITIITSVQIRFRLGGWNVMAMTQEYLKIRSYQTYKKGLCRMDRQTPLTIA